MFRKIFVFAVLVSVAVSAYSQDEKMNGVYPMFGIFGSYQPNAEFTQLLSEKGYKFSRGVADADYGVNLGMSIFKENLYTEVDVVVSLSEYQAKNDVTGLTLRKNADFAVHSGWGYTLFHNDVMAFVPEIITAIGYKNYSFSRDDSLGSFIGNPVVSPSFAQSFIAIGAGVNLFVFPAGKSAPAGILKLQYFYTVVNKYAIENAGLGVELTGAPAINPHSAVLSVNFSFGPMNRQKKFEAEKLEIEEQKTNI